MKNYEPSFNFIKQNDNEIVAKSLDGNHNFVLPFDLDSIDAQNRIFVSLLKESIANGVNPSESFVIELNRFKSCIMKLECVNDKHVALAIFEYLIKIGHYSFNDDGNIRILEEVTDDMFDNPILMQKWLCVYDHLLTTTEHAANICGKMYNHFTEKFINLPDCISLLQLRQENAGRIVDILGEKAAAMELTSEDRELYREATADFIRYTRLINQEEKKPHKALEDVASYLNSISQFLYDKDIYIAAYTSAKAIFEAGREASESDMIYTIDLTKTVASLTPLESKNVEVDEEE